MNPALVESGGPFFTDAEIGGLARKIALPAAGLEATVAQFNRFCVDGGALEPARTGKPSPLTEAPFHAVPVVAGIMYTQGGVLIDGRGQVLDHDEKPIPGLYAAGGAMGGLEGGPGNGYAGGWSQSSTMGLVAAESAVEDVVSSTAARSTAP